MYNYSLKHMINVTNYEFVYLCLAKQKSLFICEHDKYFEWYFRNFIQTLTKVFFSDQLKYLKQVK